MRTALLGRSDTGVLPFDSWGNHGGSLQGSFKVAIPSGETAPVISGYTLRQSDLAIWAAGLNDAASNL